MMHTCPGVKHKLGSVDTPTTFKIDDSTVEREHRLIHAPVVRHLMHVERRSSTRNIHLQQLLTFKGKVLVWETLLTSLGVDGVSLCCMQRVAMRLTARDHACLLTVTEGWS